MLELDRQRRRSRTSVEPRPDARQHLRLLVTGTAASSACLYWEGLRNADAEPIDVPTGVSVFPREIFPASRRWAESRYHDLRHYRRLDRGGHFAAWEQPELFVDEVRTFFRTVR